ncbi:hypothetical protein AA313_de0208587 [Arthrobotrys entomopaga]|nr:hypothetical protein AA313_de0208587 [Arthrobotrys entomopaga]
MLKSCYPDGEAPFGNPDEYNPSQFPWITIKYAPSHISILWFHENIHLGRLLPGLKTVKSINHGYKELGWNGAGWHAMGLVNMLFLPKLQTLKTFRCYTWPLGLQFPFTNAKMQSGRVKSQVKSLELLGFYFRGVECFETLAEMTGSLEYLAWSSPSTLARQDEQIVGLFLQNNRGTLRRDRIVLGTMSSVRPDPNLDDEDYEDS